MPLCLGGTAVGQARRNIQSDFKRYTLHGYEIGGQVTVYEHEKISKIKSALIEYMNMKAESENYAFWSMITDLNNKTAELQLSADSGISGRELY